MDIMEQMNYNMINPKQKTNVIEKITERFVSRERNIYQLSQYEAWLDLTNDQVSKEMLSAYKKQNEFNYDNVINVVR